MGSIPHSLFNGFFDFFFGQAAAGRSFSDGQVGEMAATSEEVVGRRVKSDGSDVLEQVWMCQGYVMLKRAL